MTTLPAADDTPRRVPWSTVVDRGNVDERVSAVTCLFGSVIGVNEDNIEWVPDDIPSSENERLAWVWLCNPDLWPQVLPHATGWFRSLVVAYRDGEMEQWWQDFSRDT